MAKKVEGYIKLQIPAGKATPAPPVGPALGQHGVNIVEFTKQFNARTADQGDLIIPVVITVYNDRSFSFITKTPPAAVLIKKACKIQSGSGVPNKTKVATITKAQVREIAEMKMPDLNAASVEAAESIREASVSYDSAIDAVKQELSEAKAEISALKEQVSHLVGLLKDNNVATTKLMKQGVELNHVFSQCDEISVDMIEACRQQIVSIRNTQEEIIKFEERNKLQIEDAYAEISTQRKNSVEIKSTVDKVLDYSRERVR